MTSQFMLECLARDAQPARGGRDVAFARIKRETEHVRFHLLQCGNQSDTARRGSADARRSLDTSGLFTAVYDMGRQMLDADERPLRHLNGGLHSMLQFADIARPGMLHEDIHYARRDASNTHSELRAVLLHEMVSEGRDVISALSERGYLYDDHPKPVEEIAAEKSSLYSPRRAA